MNDGVVWVRGRWEARWRDQISGGMMVVVLVVVWRAGCGMMITVGSSGADVLAVGTQQAKSFKKRA